MSKTLKIRSISLLAVLMIAALLSACSGGGNGSAGSGSGSDSSGAASETPAADSEQPKETPVYDFNFVMWGYADQFADGKKPKYWQQVSDEINKKLEAARGIKLNFHPLAYPMDTIGEKINLELAAGTEIDLVKMNGDFFQTFGDKQAAMDITDLLQRHGQHILAKYPQNVWDEFTREGKIYAIPQVDFPYFYGGWVRSDWLDQAGLALPTTVAELENVLKTLRDGDLDGNGQADTLPMTGHVDAIIDWILGMYTSHPGDYVEGGAIRQKVEDPGYEQALTTITKWYNENYVDDSIFDMANTNIAADLFGKDRLGIELASVWELEWGALNAVHKAKGEDVFKFMGTMNEVNAFPASAGISGAYVFIPAASKNAEAVIQYIDWLYEAEENYVLHQPGLGIEGTTFVLGPNFAPELPQAEKDAGVKEGEILSGPYSNMMIVQYNLKYMPAVTPVQTRAAYDFVMNLDLSRLYVPVTKSLGTVLDDNLKLKQTDLETLRKEYVQKIITGSATYAEFINAWKKAGGEEINAAHTAQYQSKQ